MVVTEALLNSACKETELESLLTHIKGAVNCFLCDREPFKPFFAVFLTHEDIPGLYRMSVTLKSWPCTDAMVL